jgi:5,10-methylenetetrahydromethanopterin reductase
VTDGFRALGVSISKLGGVPLTDTIELARVAEEAGFGIAASGEDSTENFAVMGALAMRTSQIELLSNIASLSRTPMTAAIGARTLAELSGGRYRLGLGTMPPDWREGWHDIPRARPVDRMRDYVAAIRAVWDAGPGKSVRYEGPFYRIPNFRPVHVSLAALRVPIYLAVTRPRMAELAGEIADGISLNVMVSSAWLADVLWPAVERGLARSGRTRADVDVGLIRACVIDDDADAARDVARRNLAFYFHAPYFRDVLEHEGLGREGALGTSAAERGDPAGMLAAVTDEMLERFVLAGTPDEVRRQIRAYEGVVDWIELVSATRDSGETDRLQAERIIDTFRAREPARSPR